MSVPGSPECPLRVAIVGSGPSGFYAADALTKSGHTVVVDMFDRYPTPYGLVRFGVAPDHQKIKSVVKVYERIAQRPGVTLWGNVTIGRDIPVADLRAQYHAVIFASGAESDRRLDIPGEDLPGSHTATEFVAWYNGRPEYRNHHFDLSQEIAVIIGQGNVAIDVCRILAKTVNELKETDIAQHALDALAESRVREIYMIGRRGPAQAKFTPHELKEMEELADCDPFVDPEALRLSPISQAELDDKSNINGQRVYNHLKALSEYTPTGRNRHFHIRFLQGPVAILGDDRVQAIQLEYNRLEGEIGRQRAVGTGETMTLPCGLVFRSVGYRGTAIPGVPFREDRGIIPNDEGRITENGVIVPGMYVVGWIKRGPSGVIGTNKPDSFATVDRLLEDIPNLPPCAVADSHAIHNMLESKKLRPVSFEDWQKIDAHEVALGQESGKPREKLTDIAAMLACIA